MPVDRNPGAARRVPAGEVGGWHARMAAAAFVAVWELARRLPEAVVFAGANLGGRLAWYLSPGLRAGITRNLARVVPAGDLERCARDAFCSYARYWVESFRSTDLSGDDLDRRTTTSGFEHLDRALTEGKGVIVLLAHHGSWDVAARWAEDHGYHMAAVAEVIEPRRLFERFVRLRESIGLEVVPLQSGSGGSGQSSSGVSGRHRGMRLARVLAANHLVGLLSDRDVGGSGTVVQLFGDAAALPRGPVVLSQRTGAPIVPITMLQRPGRRWHLQVLPPVDVSGEAIESGVQLVAKAIEELIRLAPAQWHAFSPVFVSDKTERS
ncbi:MAG: phosphatidylinositol mannoside acyltransferase [Egibacteraceae bacterium]